MRKNIFLCVAITSLLLICCACTHGVETMEKDANPFFIQSELPEISVDPESLDLEVAEITPPPNIVNISGKEKIDIIAETYPDFYTNLNRTLSGYERGNLLDFVNIFLNTKIKDEYLINAEIDKKIIENTNVEILSAIVSENQLILETRITYLPILITALSKNENIINVDTDYNKYIGTNAQSEYFTLTFDILKFSSSEGVKIKDYKYKDYIIRALTNTLYDSKKYILEYSEDNNQELFDNLVKDLREKNYEAQEWMTPEIVRNLQENESFLQVMLESFTIKSINKEYFIITYPDVKNSIEDSNLEMEEIMTLVSEQKINLVSKIVHDPDLNKLYNLIKNLMIV